MKQRNSEHFPEKNICDVYVTSSSTVTPDLNTANVYRIDATDDLIVGNPANLRDGQRIRIEVSSVPGKTVTFGSKYLYHGEVMTDTRDMETLVIVDGYYNKDRDKIDIRSIAGSPFSALSLTYLVNDAGLHITNEAETAEIVLNT